MASSISFASPDSKHSETLLLADDDLTLQRVTSLLLRNYGFEVLAAGDGQEALDLCQEHPGPIALALLDLHMPVMSGREATARIKALRPDLKVIWVTGNNDMTHSDEANALLRKPFEIDELVRVIRNVLDSPADRP